MPRMGLLSKLSDLLPTIGPSEVVTVENAEYAPDGLLMCPTDGCDADIDSSTVFVGEYLNISKRSWKCNNCGRDGAIENGVLLEK